MKRAKHYRTHMAWLVTMAVLLTAFLWLLPQAKAEDDRNVIGNEQQLHAFLEKLESMQDDYADTLGTNLSLEFTSDIDFDYIEYPSYIKNLHVNGNGHTITGTMVFESTANITLQDVRWESDYECLRMFATDDFEVNIIGNVTVISHEGSGFGFLPDTVEVPVSGAGFAAPADNTDLPFTEDMPEEDRTGTDNIEESAPEDEPSLVSNDDGEIPPESDGDADTSDETTPQNTEDTNPQQETEPPAAFTSPSSAPQAYSETEWVTMGGTCYFNVIGGSFTMDTQYRALYLGMDLQMTADNGSVDIHSENSIAIYTNKDEGSGKGHVTINAKNGSAVTLSSNSPSGEYGAALRADLGYAIAVSGKSKMNVSGIVNAICFSVHAPSHFGGNSSISVTDGSIFTAYADGDVEEYGDHIYAINHYSGLDIHVDDSIFVAKGTSQGIYNNHNTIASTTPVYSGSPRYFLIEGGENSGVYNDGRVASFKMIGAHHGVFFDEENPTPYYAVVGTPVLSQNAGNPQAITVTTSSVLLDVSKLADWDSTEVDLYWAYGDDSFTKTVLPITRTGATATADVSSLLGKTGTYRFVSDQTVDGYESNRSNVLELKVAEITKPPVVEPPVENPDPTPTNPEAPVKTGDTFDWLSVSLLVGTALFTAVCIKRRVSRSR